MLVHPHGSGSMFKRMPSKDGTNSTDLEDDSGKSLILYQMPFLMFKKVIMELKDAKDRRIYVFQIMPFLLQKNVAPLLLVSLKGERMFSNWTIDCSGFQIYNDYSTICVFNCHSY